MDFYAAINAALQQQEDLSLFEAIGVLELVKAELIAAAGDEEEGDEG